MCIEIINKKLLDNNSYDDIFIVEDKNGFKIYIYPMNGEKVSEKINCSLEESRKYILDILNFFLTNNKINGIDYSEIGKLTLHSEMKLLNFFGYDEYFSEVIDKIKEDFFSLRDKLLENKEIRYYSFGENYYSSTAYFNVEFGQQKIYFALANKDEKLLIREKEFLDNFLDFFFTLNPTNNIIVEPLIYWDEQDCPEPQGYLLENGDKVINCPLYLFSYIMMKAEEYENKDSLKLNRILIVKRKNEKINY